MRIRFNARAGMDDSWPSYTMAEVNAMLAAFDRAGLGGQAELDVAVRIRREVADEMIVEQRVAERLPGECLDAAYRRMRGR